MGWVIDHLLEEPDAFHMDPERAATMCREAIEQSFEHHYQGNPLYRRICDGRGLSPQHLREPEDLRRIPLLSTRAFKEDLAILSVPEDQIVKTHHSSGTSGTRSYVPRDELTLGRFSRSLQMTILEIQGDSGYIATLGPPPEELGDLSFANWAKIGCGLAEDYEFFLRDYEFDPEHIVDTVNDVSIRPVQIGGSPMLVLELAKYILDSGRRITTLTEESRITSGGGFKMLTGDAVTREEYDERVMEAFGVPRRNIRDFYALSEVNGVMSECEENVKHVPPWLHLSVRDPAQVEEEVGPGHEGLAAFLDPLAHAYPGFLLADDIVKVVVPAGERCACGRIGPCLAPGIRRAESAESRGCGRHIEELRAAAR